jgi:hypothetical protein
MVQPIATKGDTLWMTSYDPYGYNGREYHPDQSDVGLLGEVVRVDHHKEADFYLEPGDCDYVCYTVLTYEKEPRFLEWMDHEVTKIEERVAA